MEMNLSGNLAVKIHMTQKTHSTAMRRGGFTLVELVAVVAIIAMLALVAVRSVSHFAQSANETAAKSDLMAIRSALVDQPDGYLANMRGIPGFSLGFLRVGNLLISTNLYGRAENSETGERVDAPSGTRLPGCAQADEFTKWNDGRGRGWRGPYLHGAAVSGFPARNETRFPGDPTFAERGFFPALDGLLLPTDFKAALDGCSPYGFPGEPCALDPWGNPYVLQIPPPQAFAGPMTNVTDELRWHYARIVSAGPDGTLSTPCFEVNATNVYSTSWTPRKKRMSRQAGLVDGSNKSARGDDIVLFIERADIDEFNDVE